MSVSVLFTLYTVHFKTKKILISLPEFSAKYSALILGFCGMAPLHFVARYGSKLKDTKESLTFLMHCMDNPLQEDEFGNTVLHHAILNQSESIR